VHDLLDGSQASIAAIVAIVVFMKVTPVSL